MLLILTNSEDVTASFLASRLSKSGVPFIRFDTDLALARLAFSYCIGIPRLKIADGWYEPADIHDIWYRRPESLKHSELDDSPEGKYTLSEWTEFVENFLAHVPTARWMNHPSQNAAASRKLDQLTTASGFGFKVPETLVTQDPDTLKSFYHRHSSRVIAKPVSTGYVERPSSENDGLIYTNALHDEDLEDLNSLRACPTLFQEFILKKCDVRITVVDSDVHSVALVAQDYSGLQACDIRRNNMAGVAYSRIELPDAVRRGIGRLMAHYRLRFGAIDMVVSTADDWYFLEINPNGQWAWLDETAGTDIASSFVKSFSVKIPDELTA